MKNMNIEHTSMIKVTHVKRQKQRNYPHSRNTNTSWNGVYISRTKSITSTPAKITKTRSYMSNSFQSFLENSTNNRTSTRISMIHVPHSKNDSHPQNLIRSKNSQSFSIIPPVISIQVPSSSKKGSIGSIFYQTQSHSLQHDRCTIGKTKKMNNKKWQCCQNCSSRYLLMIGIILILILGGLSVIPALLLTSKTITTFSTGTELLTSTDSNTNSTTINTTTMVTTVTITSNPCTSSWFDVTIIYHCDNCPIRYNYRRMSYNYTAKANETRLSFAMRRDMGYFALDDISAINLAYPNINLIVNSGFESGILYPWNYCNITGALQAGSIQSTSNAIIFNNHTFVALSGSYYYLGGATIYPDYISQTFTTNISDMYMITFSYLYVGNGSQSSGDFLLSI